MTEEYKTCRFCGVTTDVPCESAEQALLHTEQFPFGCPWMDDEDRAAATRQVALKTRQATDARAVAQGGSAACH